MKPRPARCSCQSIERGVPAGEAIDTIADDYGSHKHAKVIAWLDRHPRWIFDYTPTSASRLNALEGLFSALTRRRLERGVLRSVVDLQAAINRSIEEHNNDPKPFVRTRSADRILE